MSRSPSHLLVALLAVLVLAPSTGVGSPEPAAPTGSATATQASVLTPELLWSLQRVGAPQVSPDGSRLIFGVTRYDLADNAGNTDLYLLPVAGGTPRRLTHWEGSEFNAVWRPDGEWIGFLSGHSGSVQLWEIHPGTGELRQVSDVEGGIGNFAYAPDGRHVSFTRGVKLADTPQDVHPDLPEADARIIDSLMYRHWDRWDDYRYNHLFVAEYDDGELGPAVDVMPGETHDTPLEPFGGPEQIAWSADGGRIAYTSKKMPATEYAVSTNSDLYLYDRATEATVNLSDGNPGYDVEPVFSPDGRWVAWLSMAREGYESDRNRLLVAPLPEGGAPAGSLLGEARELTAGFDQDAHGPVWSPDSSRLWFTSETRGTVQVYEVGLEGTIRQVTEGVQNFGGLAVADLDGAPVLVASRTSMSSPAEIWRIEPASGDAAALTGFNDGLLAGIELGRVERRVIEAGDGADVVTWVIYPPGFDASRSYPALLYAQGGPQSAVSQFFSYRWNFQLMAANGYVIVAPNRRGVPGLGQEFKEQISGDWGGRAMQDLLDAIDAVAAEPFVDEERLGAVGASFGGYTVFWLAGHHEGRFDALIAHAGVFNLESMYGATEELFFVDWDLGGPYWQEPTPPSYERFSPHDFVGRWDTPMLVIHGQRDFRVPVTQGMEAFTALQARGIESRLLYFPDEGHWILSPQNGVLWHRVFFDWLDRFLK